MGHQTLIKTFQDGASWRYNRRLLCLPPVQNLHPQIFRYGEHAQISELKFPPAHSIADGNVLCPVGCWWTLYQHRYCQSQATRSRKPANQIFWWENTFYRCRVTVLIFEFSGATVFSLSKFWELKHQINKNTCENYNSHKQPRNEQCGVTHCLSPNLFCCHLK